VQENVAFAPRNSSQNAASVDESLAIFELAALASRMPRDLSGGQQQRVNLARAFAVPAPKLMLLDEPFSGIDRALRDTLLPKMRERMAALGVPVISVTHDVEEALLLGADVVRLQDGKVVAQGPAAVVLAAERDRMLRVLESS
jgi:molybdate transport system ATP-binding protein